MPAEGVREVTFTCILVSSYCLWVGKGVWLQLAFFTLWFKSCQGAPVRCGALWVSLKQKILFWNWRGKNTGLLCLYDSVIFTTELHMLIVIHLSSTKKKGVPFFQSFHLVPLVRVTSIQGLVCVLPAFFLPGLLWKCPCSPLTPSCSSPPVSEPALLLFLYFFWRWCSPACPVKNSLMLRRVAWEK